MIRQFTYYLIIIATLTSCERVATEEEIELFVQTNVAKRLEYLANQKKKDCYMEVLKVAEKNIDSIILSQFEVDLLDSIQMVEKPFKPLRPQYIRDIDTSQIRPIFE